MKKEDLNYAIEFINTHREDCPKFYDTLLSKKIVHAFLPAGADLDNYCFITSDDMIFYAADIECQDLCFSWKLSDISKFKKEDFEEIIENKTNIRSFLCYENAEDIVNDLKNYGKYVVYENLWNTGNLTNISRFETEYKLREVVIPYFE